jgi:hypothetical protein
LHGIILADAYAIRAVHISFSDKVAGGSFKFNDYFASVGRPAEANPMFVDNSTTAAQIWEHAKRHIYSWAALPNVTQGLISSCPLVDAPRKLHLWGLAAARASVYRRIERLYELRAGHLFRRQPLHSRRTFYLLFSDQVESPSWPQRLCVNNGVGPQGNRCVDARDFANGSFIVSPQNFTDSLPWSPR